MLKRRTIYLDVTDRFVDGALATDPARAERVWLAELGSEASWDEDSLREAMGRFAQALGARGARAVVLWRAGGATPVAVETAAQGKAAPAAATLSLVETGEVDAERQWVATRALAETAEQSTVVAASAVDDRVARMLERAATGAGLRWGRALAGDALGAAAAVWDVMRAEADDPAATLVLGEQQSAIAVRSADGLRLCRFIDVGAAALRESYVRALAGRDAVEHQAADRLLWDQEGVPAPRESTSDEVDLAEALRAMQPVLQRLGVELKQSVRFTLGDSERLRVRLRVAGPGRRIRGLATVLAEQLEVEAAEAEPAGPSAAGGWIELALASGAAAWRPEAPGEVAGGGRDVREAALWSGVAAAGIGIGAVGLIATQSAERSRVDAARALQVVERLESERVEPSERELRERAADLRRLVSSEAGTGAAFGAALRLASRAAGDGVMLESLTGRRDQDGSWLELRARAMGETAEAARARFGALVSALDDSALSTETTAGSMRLREGRGAFEASGPATVRLLERESTWMPREAGR